MNHPTAPQLLQQYFGFTQFRPGQLEVVSALLDGESAVAIFPTGSGKSLCYQLPAIALPQLTLVISPLLALIQDQLRFLHSKGMAAASIDSTQSKEQIARIMTDVRAGKIKILMISVERFNNERFRHFIAQVPISLLVVDEAHCISEWGHNFRPDYLKLPQYREEFNVSQILLLTATATEQVIADMRDKFAIADANVVTTGFYRANLHLAAQGVRSEDKLSHLTHWLQDKREQSGIVYVTQQNSADQLAEQLGQQGFDAQSYHAGMDSQLRQQVQHRFMRGELKLIVATIAFGMGIDKSDIRYVVHYDLPKSIENYAQEIGRAGRDGKPSRCLVLLNNDNLNVLENFVYGDTPEPQAIEYVLDQVAQAGEQWSLVLNTLANASNIRPLVLKTLLVYLEMAHLIKPAYSYYAEYKFKFITEAQHILSQFEGERRNFLSTVFNTAHKARTWFTLDLERFQQCYQSDRRRVLVALDYLAEKGHIELQSKQPTLVYQVFPERLDKTQLVDLLQQRFANKEQSEIERIHLLLEFFSMPCCLSSELANYFGDYQLMDRDCGHCSSCDGQPAELPPEKSLPPLTDYELSPLAQPIRDKLGDACTPTLLARFFCGLVTPIFTRYKVRSIEGWGALQHYRFAEVREWVRMQYGNSGANDE